MNKIYKAFESITPNEFDNINEQLKCRHEEVVLDMETPKRKWNYKWVAVMVVCLLVVGIPFAFNQTPKVFATVGIDVNPSIELQIDKQEKVIDVLTLNSDGEKILGDMDLQGSDVKVAMNALVGSMLKEGYIDELKNTLLISIAGEIPEENERLRQELTSNIDQLLKGNQVIGSIVSQTLSDDKNLDELAKKYHISKGKAEIIQQLIQKNSLYTFESLKDLPMNDLNILLSSNDIKEIEVRGEVSTGTYIGEKKVKDIVEKDARVSQPHYLQIELDYDDGLMVYEVEFIKNGIEYEYELDAKTGKILEKDQERSEKEITLNNQTSTQSSSQQSSSQTISKEQAKSIAMKDAQATSITNYKIEKDNDDGVLEYEIEFVNQNTKHEYTIRASDGKILNHEKEIMKSVKLTTTQARDKALQHAQLSMNQVRQLEVDLDKKGYYEVSFEANGYEYDYEIDGNTGKVIHHEKEKNEKRIHCESFS